MKKPLVYEDSALKKFNFTSLHSSRVCVFTEGESNLISVSMNDEIHLYKFEKEIYGIKPLSIAATHQLNRFSKRGKAHLCSSTPSQKDKIVYSVDSFGAIHATKITGSELEDHVIQTEVNGQKDDFLLDHFEGMLPHFSEIRRSDRNLFVMHGTRKSIHVLSHDGEFTDKISLGTYAASMSTLDDYPSLVATAEGSEIVLYDIRAPNSATHQYAQRFFTGPERLLDVTQGPRDQLMASGFSRSLCFVDLRMNQTLAQVATKAKYEVNFVSCAQNTETNDYVAFVAGADAEFKVMDLKTKKPFNTFHANDCWSGRPTVNRGIVAGVSCQGSLVIADYTHVLSTH